MKRIDVLIAGGGPAGVATALSLSRRGIPCMIVDAGSSKTQKAGETIPPNAAPLLEKIGIAHLLKEPEHLPCYGNRFVWGSTEPADSTFFYQLHSKGWHLNREQFELQLQSIARDKGVLCLSGYTTQHLKKTADGWEVHVINKEKKKQKILCRFLVDATGRTSRISRYLGINKIRIDTLTAIWTKCKISAFSSPLYTYIESVQNGWWYAAPLPDDYIAFAFMTDADLIHKKMLIAPSYVASLNATTLLSKIIPSAIMPQNVALSVHSVSTSFSKKRFDKSWVAVGDAAYSYDPISSYGIVSALEGGYYAGHAIADTFTDNEEALIAYDCLIKQSFENYKKMHIKQYQAEQRWNQEPFWKRRSRKDAIL